MNCIRCQNHDERPESVENGEDNQPISRSCESDQNTSDIGGFAEIAGCLGKLKSSEKQVGDISWFDLIASTYHKMFKLIFILRKFSSWVHL